MTDKAKNLGEIKFSDADTRTVIAAMAMKGLIECINANGSYQEYAEDATEYANCLLEELSKNE